MTATIAYIRISSTKQIENNSLDVQRDRINSYVAYKQLGEVEFYCDEGISGRSVEKRAAMQEVLSLVREGQAKHLIFYSMTRMGRNLKQATEISDLCYKFGVTMHILDLDIDTRTPVGKMVFNIMASIAQFRSDELSEKITDTHNYLRAEKKQYSRPILGFKQVGKGLPLLPIDEEMDVVKFIFAQRSKNQSMRAIADCLNEQGTKGKNGGTFREATIAKILDKKDLYQGYLSMK